MPQFFAATSTGLIDVLATELENLDLKVLRKGVGGIFFESNWRGCYLANLCLRSATRVLKPVLNFTAYQKDELYQQIRRHDFTRYITQEQSLVVDATVQDSKMHDQRLIALVVKDAVVDEFRDKFGSRPNVNKDDADLRIVIRGMKNKFEVSVDTSGDSLFMRGYRQIRHVDAPLKEHLAAGLIALTGWNKDISVVDPMCGSGTFLIEAAMMALNIAPGTLRHRFAFQNFLNFDKNIWDDVVAYVMNNERTELSFKFYGFDINRKAIGDARRSAEKAGVEQFIEFATRPIATLQNPCDKGIVVTNPPYGVRIGDEDELKDIYRDFAFSLKQHFKGWDCWILAGNKDLVRELKLKSSRKYFIYNGPIECRFLKYNVF